MTDIIFVSIQLAKKFVFSLLSGFKTTVIAAMASSLWRF